MTGTRHRRALAALLIAGWIAAGVWGAAAYGLAYWSHRGFAPPAWPARVPRGITQRLRFRSAAAGGVSSSIVHLPAGYAAAVRSGRRFPVLYLLHGTPGTAGLLVDVTRIGPLLDTLVHRGVVRPMIVVVPTGAPAYWSDTEWADSHSGRWASYLTDVVHAVDGRYATLADRGHRAIAGLSEGGYGALNIALHHLGLFSVAESWSGYFTETRSGVFRHATAAQLAANSPASYVGALRRTLHRAPTHMLLYAGRNDPEFRPAALFGFAHELRRAGAHVTVRTYPGGHDWALWRGKLGMSLAYTSRWMAP